MSDDVSVADAQTAQEPVQTAVSAPEIQQPEDNQQATKTFTQEELDAIVGKRLAREQRKWEREQQLRMQEQPKAPQELPSADKFESVEEYAEALAARKAEELLAHRQQQQREQEVMRHYFDKEEEAMEKYDDYKQVAYNPNIPISQVMAETIRGSDIGPDLAYYLGSNPQEAHRISQLPAYLQAKEIGKLELKLESNPPAKRTSSAPAPINPITPTGGGGGRYDTTDPRSVKTMSTSEWIEAENQRMMKKLQNQRY